MPQFRQSASPDGTCVISVAGEIDLTAVEALKAAVRAGLAENDTIEIDLAAMTFIDSTGLGALVQLFREAAEHRATLRLSHVSARTQRILEVTGLASAFGVAADGPSSDGASPR